MRDLFFRIVDVVHSLAWSVYAKANATAFTARFIWAILLSPWPYRVSYETKDGTRRSFRTRDWESILVMSSFHPEDLENVVVEKSREG